MDFVPFHGVRIVFGGATGLKRRLPNGFASRRRPHAAHNGPNVNETGADLSPGHDGVHVTGLKKNRVGGINKNDAVTINPKRFLASYCVTVSIKLLIKRFLLRLFPMHCNRIV